MTQYHFGGYAKTTTELVDFAKRFYKEYQLKLDLVYTAKMFYGVMDLIKQGYFSKGSTILTIHTGGLQGNRGMENKLKISLFGS